MPSPAPSPVSTPAGAEPGRASVRRSRHRGAAQALLDAMAWAVAVVLTTRRPPSFSVERVPWDVVGLLVGLSVLAALVVGTTAGLYASRWQYGSFEEVSALAPSAFLSGLLVIIVNRYVLPDPVPSGATVAAPALALLLMSGTRYVWRLMVDRRMRPDSRTAERLLVFGAGRAGTQIVATMRATPDSRYLPVAFLDDDPSMRKCRIKGVPVVGGRDDLAEAAARYGASRVLLAISSAQSPLIRELTDAADAAGLAVSVLPSVNELVRGRPRLDDIREVTPADLLGRTVIDTDVATIGGYVTGRRVLVTGAGGSIGSELCRQLSRYEPATLVMLDRDESALHGVQLSIEGHALLDTPNLVVADIRDAERVTEVFRTHRPEVVFHAAALKHLPLLELHPGEAVKTNVWGTLRLLQLAAAFDVGTFVNISTDKAADPSSVLGYSKRIAERLTAGIALPSGRRYMSVRFGNVVGSRGSVLLTFQSQIEAGGPVTVTHPDVTRYFMTVEEAVQLVVQAGALGAPGEVLVLDMGQPVGIADLARRLIRTSGQDIDLVFTGLRPGEKLHEKLVAEGEQVHRSKHPLVLQTAVDPLDAQAALELDPSAPDVVQALAELCARPHELPVQHDRRVVALP